MWGELGHCHESKKTSSVLTEAIQCLRYPLFGPSDCLSGFRLHFKRLRAGPQGISFYLDLRQLLKMIANDMISCQFNLSFSPVISGSYVRYNLLDFF